MKKESTSLLQKAAGYPSHRNSRCNKDCRRVCLRKHRPLRRRRLKENQRRRAERNRCARLRRAAARGVSVEEENAARQRRAYHPMQFGDYRVEIIPDCEFRLDGGAMFGVVPRNLWSKPC